MNVRFDAKRGALILFAVLVVILLVVYAFLRGGSPQGGGAPNRPAAAAPSYAPKGSLVSGFPKELILDAAAQVSNSYSINYSSALNQYTAEWNSSLSMASLYMNYKTYLPKNGWTITNTIEKYPTLRGIYATNGSRTANIAITTQGKGSRVSITYTTKWTARN